jgi:hypothetical protein
VDAEVLSGAQLTPALRGGSWCLLPACSCRHLRATLEFGGTHIAKAGMTPGLIVIAFDATDYLAAHSLPVAQVMAMEPLDLQRMEEALGHGIVVAESRFTHALADARQAQPLVEALAGVLASTIGMEDEADSGAALTQRHVHRLHDDGRLQAGGEGPADDTPRNID